MGGISMAVKFRHKETGLFFCRAKGLSPNQKRDWIGKEHADEFEIVKV